MFGGTALTTAVILGFLRKHWPPLLLAVLAVAAVTWAYRSGNASGRAAVQAQWDKERAALQAAVTEAKDKDINQGQQASARYQEQKANEKERIRVVRQVVTRTVTGECFDAGSLQHLNEAIRPVSAASAAR